MASERPSFEEVAFFEWGDWAALGATLVATLSIGVACGVADARKKASPRERLFGRVSSSALPYASFSLVANTVTGASLIALPADVYSSGAAHLIVVPALFVVCLVFYCCFVPMYYDLKFDCIYEYVERRFNRPLRILISTLYCLASLLFLPLVIYVPANALRLISNVNVHIIASSLVIICLAYTIIGGLRGVILTDFFHMILILVVFAVVLTIGTIRVGIWQMGSYYDEDPDVPIEINPIQTNRVLSIFIGTTFFWTCGMISSQSVNQRYMTLPNREVASLAVIIYLIGTIFITVFGIYAGALARVVYKRHDPVEHELVDSSDIILYCIFHRLGDIAFIPGLFVATIVVASMSTLSSTMNTISGVLYSNHSSKLKSKSWMVLLLCPISIGVATIGLGVLCEEFEIVSQFLPVVSSALFLPVGIVFLLGITNPSINTFGALSGVAIGGAFALWTSIGSAIAQRHLLSEEFLTGVLTNTSAETTSEGLRLALEAFKERTFLLHRLPSDYCFLIATVLAAIVAVAVSLASGRLCSGVSRGEEIDEKLISPPLRRLYYGKGNKSKKDDDGDDKGKEDSQELRERNRLLVTSGKL